ncbi:hypothetical protein RclHR1_05240006 [Rhizophagus clarus]|uniref:Uncharacterized protein n=1 Tax=Rhizophagus clarus TaxID=94130 RepID=A0A2Z6SEA7_9GLOM|nr:hypothetical protein RclHR1_05240006 [Rhizophagus clarus]GES95716.1 hypothetical protein GLOIN_2v1868487 [Rhizophagus clarus]
MNKNLNYDRQPFTTNYSQPVPTNQHIITSESLDFSTEIPIIQHQESISSQGNDDFVTYNVTNQVAMQHQQTLPIISYLKFYHFYVNLFYLVTCKIILQEDSSFCNHDRYSHEFFYQHPNDPSIRYHVTCKSLSNSLVENILNDEICGMDFDTELLSLNQKFDIEQRLKQKLFHRMQHNRNTNSFHNNVGNHEMIVQPVSMANVQNYNDSYLINNDEQRRFQ